MMLPGPTKVSCPCGCGKFGTVAKRTGHVRDCDTSYCAKCRAGANRRSGIKQQKKAAKSLGVRAATAGQLGNEEAWRWQFRVEVKSGLQVQPIQTRFLHARAQAEEAKALGDPRPFLMVAAPPHGGRLVVIEESVWASAVAPHLPEVP